MRQLDLARQAWATLVSLLDHVGDPRHLRHASAAAARTEASLAALKAAESAVALDVFGHKLDTFREAWGNWKEVDPDDEDLEGSEAELKRLEKLAEALRSQSEVWEKSVGRWWVLKWILTKLWVKL